MSHWRQPWVVHSKSAGAGEHALAYLARHTFRVALADTAIVHHNERKVGLRHRDEEAGKPHTARLAPQAFSARFASVHASARGPPAG